MTDISIIIVNWNTRDLLKQCLQSIYDSAGSLAVQILVVDNGSTDGSVEMLRRDFPQTEDCDGSAAREILVLANVENVGFVKANNQALPQARGRYVLLLNSDTKLLPKTLKETVQFMDAHPQAGVCGARLLNPGGSFQASYTPFPTLGREFLILSGLGRLLIASAFPSCGPEVEKGPQRIKGYMEGAYLMARREALASVGGLDENIFMYAEDVDWCYRFYRAGWELWYLPQVTLIHYGGQSSKKRRSRMEAELYRSRVYFFHKHYGKRHALALKALIYTVTLFKIAFHTCLRVLTLGHRGRVVPSWRELHVALSEADGAPDPKAPALMDLKSSRTDLKTEGAKTEGAKAQPGSPPKSGGTPQPGREVK